MPDPTTPTSLHLVTLANMSEAAIYRVGVGTAAVFSAGAPGKARENEDGAVLLPIDETRGLIAVADGVGGHTGGALAASLALSTLAETVLAGLDDGLSMHGSILRGFEHANTSVLALGVGAATTLAVVELDALTSRTYHAGDSMILTVSNRGRVKRQTVSHSPVGYAVESGMLGEKEALHHADRHIVSNLIGSPAMRIEIGSSQPFARLDTMVLASDGLFDNLHVEEVVETIRKGALSSAADSLHRQAHDRMLAASTDAPSKPDDLTFILFRPRVHTS